MTASTTAPPQVRGRFSWTTLIPVAVFIAAWEVVARFEVVASPELFPPVSVVAVELFGLIRSGMLTPHFLASLVRVVAGLLIGTAAGLTAGTLMGWSDLAHRSLHPLISLLYPIPALGWLPLLMIWVGIGEALPIAVVFVCSFFPVVYTTAAGLRRVDRRVLDAARCLGASEWRVLSTVAVPLALPEIFTGLRLEAGMAWRVILAAEMVAIPTGIGALMMRAESLVRVDILMACLVVLSVMCFLFEYSVRKLEKWWTAPWNPGRCD